MPYTTAHLFPDDSDADLTYHLTYKFKSVIYMSGVGTGYDMETARFIIYLSYKYSTTKETRHFLIGHRIVINLGKV